MLIEYHRFVRIYKKRIGLRREDFGRFTMWLLRRVLASSPGSAIEILLLTAWMDSSALASGRRWLLQRKLSTRPRSRADTRTGGYWLGFSVSRTPMKA